MSESLNVLVVCRANVCRSPLAATLIARYARASGLGDAIVVHSAGSDAWVGSPACEQAQEWVGSPLEHRASMLTRSDLIGADLVLAADRESRAASAILSPECRPRLFTLRQGAALAAVVSGSDQPTADLGDRLRWWVGEWDGDRALLSGRDEESDDIVDRHGPGPHTETFLEVDEACRAIVAGFARFGAAEPI